MSFAFNPTQGLIIVQAELTGPAGTVAVSLALDTGATMTLVNHVRFIQAGYDPAAAASKVHVTTGSGVESVALLTVTRLAALGQERIDFPVLSHTLPPSAGVDGVLGLDFLRGLALMVDFRSGTITLS